MQLPSENFIGRSSAEDFVWKKFNEFFPNDYVSFHNYSIYVNEIDVIVLVPRFGILLIEIKGYDAKNILNVPDNSKIILRNSVPEQSPFKQVTKYWSNLLNYLKENNIDNVFVARAVCYPFINKDDYITKELNKVSHEKITLLKEDFINSDSLIARIDSIFEIYYENIDNPIIDKYRFIGDLFEKVGNLISPNYKNILVDPTLYENTSISVEETNIPYSVFIYEDDIGIVEEIIPQLIVKWKKGCKIYFYTSSNEALKIALLNIEHALKEIKLLVDNDNNCKINSKFRHTNVGTYNFTVGFSSVKLQPIFFENGINANLYSKSLEQLHTNSSFNYNQYKLEHEDDINIIVKAGAGTGKTYSIIARINYLIWKNNYNADELKQKITMITFTNEAANSMKKKLAEDFFCKYILTRNIKWFNFIEVAENMNISTIHSFAKRIISENSVHLGLGKDFRIITAKTEREKLIDKQLSELLVNNPKLIDDLDIPVFYLSKRIEEVISKLENKNLDIVKQVKDLDFGTSNPFEPYINLIYSTEKNILEYCKENNAIALGDLIKRLSSLYDLISKYPVNKEKMPDFMFVDEFQDTDDVQIDILKNFSELWGYKFFVVGDIKQCIYRFRGAEVKAFDTLKKKNSEFSTITLNKNYRTDSLLLEKMNKIFSNWCAEEKLVYEEDDVLIGTIKKCDEAELIETVCSESNFASELIKNLDEYKRDGKVAILVRYNWQISEIKQICDENGILIETEIGGELFKNDPTIDFYKLVMALKYNKSATYLYNLYTTSYISSPMPKRELVNMANNDELVEYFYNNLPRELKNWNTYVERLSREPILKVLRNLIDEAKPWSNFALNVNKSIEKRESFNSNYYLNNLDQLFEELINITNTDFLTINKLLSYLDVMILTKQEKDARETFRNLNRKHEIICTTVHKSKGLEFDTVILPYCDFNIISSVDKGDVDLIYSNGKIGYKIKGSDRRKIIFENNLYKELRKDEVDDRIKEETRILYVALTRAIKRVIHFTDKDKISSKTLSWTSLIKSIESHN